MYHLSRLIKLGAANSGLTGLKCQLVDVTGANVGSVITTGFVELATGSGEYGFDYSSYPASFRGFGKVFKSDGTTFLTSFNVNPEEGENVDAKISSIATTVVVSPLVASVANAISPDNDITVYQGTAPTLAFSSLKDSTGATINLTGQHVRFVVYSKVPLDTTILLEKDTGGAGVTAGNGTASVTLATTDTATIGRWRYFLWLIDSPATVLAEGHFGVVQAVKGS